MAAVGLRFRWVRSVCGLRRARGGADGGRLQRGGAAAPDPATAAAGLRLRRIGSVVCFGEFQVPHYLHPLLPRHLKLLCSAAFMAKPALISLIDATSAASTAVPCLGDGLTGDDWAAVSKAISDLRYAIAKGLGFQAEGLKVSGFDVRDVLVGQAAAYEFDIEVGKKVLPVPLLEDVNRWDFVDLPIFQSQADADDTAFAEIRRGRRGSVVEPTLPSFQPMELWIQEGDDVRLALPDVEEELKLHEREHGEDEEEDGQHLPLVGSCSALLFLRYSTGLLIHFG